MDIKKVLVGLLDNIQQNGNDFHDVEMYGMRFPDTVSNEAVADYLIAHGVTIQRWIPVSEQLPTEDGWYQVWTKTKAGGAKSFNKAYFCHGNEWHGSGGSWSNVTHWKPFPSPPDDN